MCYENPINTIIMNLLFTTSITKCVTIIIVIINFKNFDCINDYIYQSIYDVLF